MKAWWSELLDKILKAVKTLIPAIAVAIYDHLKHRIKKEENKNKKLQTELDIKEDQKKLKERNENTPDADVVDQFISDNSGDGE